MLDIAVAYNKYKFVGHEFLTWLWYMMDNEIEKLAETEPEIQSMSIGNRIVFESRNQNDSAEVITIKGDEADLAEGIIALKKGATVSEMNVVITVNDSQWKFGIKGESLAFSSMKVPETGNIENMEEEEDGAVLERLFLFEKAVNIMDGIYRMFIRLRISEDWSRKTVPAIQKWISGTNAG